MSLLIQAASYVGDYAVGDTVRFKFNATDVTGALATITGAVVSIYKDDGTTESTAGVTLAAAFDSRTGLYAVTIDTSADGTFYSKGSEFEAVLTTGAIGAVSVIGTVVGHFSLANRTLADGKTHGGTTAKLRLGSAGGSAPFYVTNASGAAVHWEGGGSGDGLYIAGAGTGNGITIYSGDGDNGAAVYMQSLANNNGTGLYIVGAGTLPGLRIDGGTTSPGAIVSGGFTSGPGLQLTGRGADSGLEVIGGSSGDAVYIHAAAGNGINVSGAGSGKYDIKLSGTGTLSGIIPANVKKVNDVTVTGTGASGDEWGP
jgi:hypothetical protein